MQIDKSHPGNIFAVIKAMLQRPIDWLLNPPQRFIRLVMVAGVLLVCMYLSRLMVKIGSPSQLITNPIVLAVAGAVGAVVFLRRPQLGLLIQVPALIMVVKSMGTGSETRISLAIVLMAFLMGLWVFDMIARQRTFQIFPSTVLPSLAAFLLVGCIALGVAQIPWFPSYSGAPLRAQVGQLGVYVLSFGAFLWVGNQVQDAQTLEKIMKFFFLAAALVIAGEIVPPLSRFTGYLVNTGAKGSLFWTWLIGLAFAQLAINRNLSLRWKIGLAGLISAAFYVSLIQYRAWSSGWIPPVVAILIIFWFALPKYRKLAIFLACLTAIFFIQKVYDLVMVGDNQYSLLTRLEAWKIVFQITSADPLFGLGLANYYWYTRIIPIMGYRVVFNSHNNYVDLYAQTGIVGILCFVWFAGSVIRLAWRLRNISSNDFTQAFIYGAFGAWIGTLFSGMLGDWMLPFVYNIGYAGMPASLIGWFFLGGLLFFERIASAQQNPTVLQKNP